VDRLSGVSERHATACIEFREGCGLWTVVGFRDEAARDQWQDPVKAAFRLLADTGFGGERSRGWGRSETPEFVEGTLPGLIIEYKRREPSPPVEEPPSEEPAITEPPPTEEPAPEPPPPLEEPPDEELSSPEREPRTPVEAEAAAIGAATVRERSDAPETNALEPDADKAAQEVVVSVGPEVVVAEPEAEPISETTAEVQTTAPEAESVAQLAPESVAGEPLPDGGASDGSEPAPETDPAITASVRAPDLTEPMQVAAEPAATTLPASTVPLQAHWLLSLFTPATDDTVDWGRGSYTVLARGGRIDSPSGSGELKKQIQMVAEGSVLYADGVPLGAAADVAPDGFAHPVFRAGFALAIPLPEVH
jgi:hypothetical protein